METLFEAAEVEDFPCGRVGCLGDGAYGSADGGHYVTDNDVYQMLETGEVSPVRCWDCHDMEREERAAFGYHDF